MLQTFALLSRKNRRAILLSVSQSYCKCLSANPSRLAESCHFIVRVYVCAGGSLRAQCERESEKEGYSLCSISPKQRLIFRLNFNGSFGLEFRKCILKLFVSSFFASTRNSDCFFGSIRHNCFSLTIANNLKHCGSFAVHVSE